MYYKKKNWSVFFKFFVRYLSGLNLSYDYNSVLNFFYQNLNKNRTWKSIIKDLEVIYYKNSIFLNKFKKINLKKSILKFFNKGLKIRKKRFTIVRVFKYFIKKKNGNILRLKFRNRKRFLNKRVFVEFKDIYLNKKRKIKLNNSLKRKEHFNNLLENFYFNYNNQDIILENKKLDYFYNKQDTLNKNNKFFNILKNKINLTKYRWKLKEYLFFYNLDNFSLGFFNINIQNYFKTYYSWFLLLKDKILVIKLHLLKLLNLYKLILKLKKKYKLFFINLKLFDIKNLYLKVFKSLKYYNNFLLVILNIKSRLNNFKLYKKLVFSSYILNLFDSSSEKNTHTLNMYFRNRYKNSEMIAYFLRDRVFNNININKFSLNNTFFFNTLVNINKSFKKKRKEAISYALTDDYAYYFFNNKHTNNYKFLFILQYFSFISLFFNKYKLYMYNFLFNYKNTINLLENKKNITKFIGNNKKFNYIKNIKSIVNVNKSYLSNFFLLNCLKIRLKKNLILNKLKKKYIILVYSNNILKKKYLLYIINIFFKNILLFFINKFSLLKMYVYFFTLFKKSKISKLTNLLKFINKKNNIIFKNRFIFKNFLNNMLNKNIFVKENNYQFFFNLTKNDIYSKYAYRNLGNKRKCILHYKERRTNIFLVLSNFKTKRVLGHVSGGQGLDRDYENSKRQKKGTRTITKILEKKFKPIVKLNKLKTVYVLGEGIWNFRLKHILKFWVLRYKLGIRYCKGLKVCYKLPHHRGLRKSNKKR